MMTMKRKRRRSRREGGRNQQQLITGVGLGQRWGTRTSKMCCLMSLSLTFYSYYLFIIVWMFQTFWIKVSTLCLLFTEGRRGAGGKTIPEAAGGADLQRLQWWGGRRGGRGRWKSGPTQTHRCTLYESPPYWSPTAVQTGLKLIFGVRGGG